MIATFSPSRTEKLTPFKTSMGFCPGILNFFVTSNVLKTVIFILNSPVGELFFNAESQRTQSVLKALRSYLAVDDNLYHNPMNDGSYSQTNIYNLSFFTFSAPLRLCVNQSYPATPTP